MQYNRRAYSHRYKSFLCVSLNLIVVFIWDNKANLYTKYKAHINPNTDKVNRNRTYSTHTGVALA